MRLGQIYSRCKKYYKDINKYGTKIEKMLDEIHTSNVVEFQDVLLLSKYFGNVKTLLNENFEDVIFLGDLIEAINFLVEEDETASRFNKLVTEEEVQDYISKIETVKSVIRDLLLRMRYIIEFCESIGISTDSIGLDIKIPETDSITELKKYIDGLEFLITKCPFFQSDEASLKVKTVDVGSMWLVMVVSCISLKAGSELLNIVAAFIDKCIILKSHKLSCEKQKYELEISQTNQKEKEIILESIEKMWKISVDNAIRDLEELAGIEIKDGDERGRVEQSFDRLEKLMDKGLQIYASIDSPEEVKAVFEPLEMHYLSKKDVLGQIEEKSDKDTDDDKN